MSFEIKPFDTVPNEILVKIFEYTHESDQMNRMSLVCTKWRQATDQASLSLLQSFGVDCHLREARKELIGSVRFLSKLIETNPDSPILKRVNDCLSKPLCSILDLGKLENAFIKKTPEGEVLSKRCFASLNLILLKIDREFPFATVLKAILINSYGNLLLSAQYNSLTSLHFHLLKKEVKKEEVQSALLPACKKGNYKMTKILIENGADPSVNKDPLEEETFLTAACKANNFTLATLLITKGAHRREANNQGLTPLAIAAKVNLKIFELLADISFSLSNTYGHLEQNTLAHFAAEGNHPQIIRLMICRKAPIDQPNSVGVTPLMTAIHSGSLDVFYELIECGADISRACNKGRTPLDYSIESDREQCLDFLLTQNLGRGLRMSSLKFAISCQNVKAMRKISASLGVTPAVKYGTILATGAAIGVMAMKYFRSGSLE